MLNNKKNNQGFTLIELLVAVSITIIITLMVFDYMGVAFKIARYSDEQTTAVQEARYSMETVIEDLRGANASEQGDYTLQTINDDGLVFFSDVDDDDIFERVEYFLATTTLYRVVTEPGGANDYNMPGATSTIAIYINNDEESIFVYFDDSYNETDIINNVRLVKIVLKINVTPEIAPNDVYVESDVNLRNLKDNL